MSNATTLRNGRHPVTLLCHPAVFIAVVVCAVNDHFLKGSDLLHGAITGKLSDVAGLFFFPILLAVLFLLATQLLTRLIPAIEGRLPTDDPRLYLDPAAILTIAVFAALNVSHSANALAEPYWGVVTMDATDLVCLPMVIVGRQFAMTRWKGAPAEHTRGLRLQWHHWGALAFAVVVSGATSPAPGQITVPGYPHWDLITPVAHCHEETEIRGWFAKSGTDGVGFVLRVDPRKGRTVAVDLDDARFLVWGDGYRVHSPALEIEGTVEEPSRTIEEGGFFYIPFFFDNDHAWDSDWRQGRIEVELRIDDEPADLRFDATQDTTALTDTYYAYQPFPYPGRDWGPDPDDPDVDISGAHPRRENEHLRRYPERPREYWVRTQPRWRGGCRGVGDDDAPVDEEPEETLDSWVRYCDGCKGNDDE